MYYIIIFSTFDIIALVVQAIGGAGASQAEQKGTDTKPSTHIMVSFHPSLYRPLVFFQLPFLFPLPLLPSRPPLLSHVPIYYFFSYHIVYYARANFIQEAGIVIQ